MFKDKQETLAAAIAFGVITLASFFGSLFSGLLILAAIK